MSAVETGDVTLRLPGSHAQVVESAIARAVDERWAERLWARDTSLWTSDASAAARITDRLGWLDAPTAFQDEIAELDAFAAGIRDDGFTDAVVMGMGGSSLAPEVLAAVLPRSARGLRLHVLDSTDPAAVRTLDEATDPATLLRIVASKSGTTTETLAFLAHHWDDERHRAGLLRRGRAGLGFVAITDPGASRDAIPHVDELRETFLNPPDVGGRYSALTYVGLVPAALLGLDLAALLRDGAAMAQRCAPPDRSNPGVALGVALGVLARAGRDKLTLVIEPELAPLGAWLEQLIAESTGKAGTGIVPVDGEPLGPPSVYAGDRVFVRVGRPTQEAWRAETGARLDTLAAAGNPVIDLELVDGAWVGGEFVRWEVATAIAGAVLGVDPFDEPNVTESKQNTKAVLERYAQDRALPADEPLARAGALRLSGARGLVGSGPDDAVGVLREHLAVARPDGYHALMAYIAPTVERTRELRALQATLRDRTRRAVTVGYGPRYLHSTGQLHKGGPASGCFLQIVAGHPDDLPIPGRRETFGVLIDAQALGDLASLRAHGLPVLRVHLSDDPDAGLRQLRDAIEAATA
jgi:glucose-6-phosphate isomerase